MMYRTIDKKGRILIPKKIINELKIDIYDNFEITVIENKIIICKVERNNN